MIRCALCGCHLVPGEAVHRQGFGYVCANWQECEAPGAAQTRAEDSESPALRAEQAKRAEAEFDAYEMAQERGE